MNATKYFILLGIFLTSFFYVRTLNAQDIKNITININGLRDSKIKDHDMISLLLPESYNTEIIDSIKWYIHFKQTNNKEYTYFISDKLKPSFRNQPKIFKCYFSQSYPSYLAGFNWGALKEVYPFGSYFTCNIYTSNNGNTNIYQLRSEEITFDVLPSTPTLTLGKTWTPLEGDNDYPMAQIHVNANNFEEGIILVEQSKDQLPIYTDTTFTTIPEEGFTISPGTWYNGVFCWVRNQYGQAMSNILKLNTTNIQQNKTYPPNIISLNGKQIIINPTSLIKVSIYNNLGILETSVITDKRINMPINKGIHIIQVTDNKNNTLKKLRVYIK